MQCLVDGTTSQLSSNELVAQKGLFTPKLHQSCAGISKRYTVTLKCCKKGLGLNQMCEYDMKLLFSGIILLCHRYSLPYELSFNSKEMGVVE